ncbi:MAG: diguanylate cyclase [Eubacteriaceae bacterium]|nr:diguanylate cyclase [Eubacteriaceae bacterium]
MDSVNMAEVIIVNGIGAFLMIFLRLTRIENPENRLIGDKLFNIIITVTLFGCLIELLTFIIDGKTFTGAVSISYLLNSMCFIGTCSVGYLWCLFTDFRIYNSTLRLRRYALPVAIPLIVIVGMNIINLNGCGIIFTVSEENVYARGDMVISAYLVLFLYFFYSIFLMENSKRRGLHIRFFPVYFFVVPCMIGTVVQGCLYGITLGWTSVAVAMVLVYIQTQSLNTFVDSLSGLYNRKYMDYIIGQLRKDSELNLYGIMIDVNDFKGINDKFGHSEGDEAIRRIGRIISESVPDNGLAVRYAGDEFLVLLKTDSEEYARKTMECIKSSVERFNAATKTGFRLSFAMGCSRYDAMSDSIEVFLSDLDRKMYDDKRRYYQKADNDRRKS